MKYMRKINEMNKEVIMTDNIIKLCKISGKSPEECQEALKSEGSMEKAIEILGKKKKEKRIFQVGDIVIRPNSSDYGKLTPDCIEFLKTYKYFKILEINENHNINIGYVSPEGKTFFFSPNRFELRDKPKIVAEPIINEEKPKEGKLPNQSREPSRGGYGDQRGGYGDPDQNWWGGTGKDAPSFGHD